MDIVTFIRNTIAILELVFFVLTMISLIKGIRTKDYKNLKLHAAVYFILNFIRRISEFMEKKSYTISIIGGADGPTSIFLAGKVGSGFTLVTFLLGILIVLFITGIVLYIRKKK